MAANALGDVFEVAAERHAFLGPDIVAGAKAEPLRPGRRERGQQAGGQLLDGVRCGAIEQPVAVTPRRRELAAEPDPPLRQRVGVAFAPERLPRARSKPLRIAAGESPVIESILPVQRSAWCKEDIPIN